MDGPDYISRAAAAARGASHRSADGCRPTCSPGPVSCARPLCVHVCVHRAHTWVGRHGPFTSLTRVNPAPRVWAWVCAALGPCRGATVCPGVHTRVTSVNLHPLGSPLWVHRLGTLGVPVWWPRGTHCCVCVWGGCVCAQAPMSGVCWSICLCAHTHAGLQLPPQPVFSGRDAARLTLMHMFMCVHAHTHTNSHPRCQHG